MGRLLAAQPEKCICHWHLYCRALACLLMRLFEAHGRFFTSCLPACLPACLAVQAGV